MGLAGALYALDRRIGVFHCDLFNTIYVELVQIHLANFLEYLINNSNIITKLKPIQVVIFYQLIYVVPTFIGLGFYIKIILNNSCKYYNDILPYENQRNILYSLILKKYNKDSEKMFKLTIDFMLKLFSIEQKFSDEEISYFLNTSLFG